MVHWFTKFFLFLFFWTQDLLTFAAFIIMVLANKSCCSEYTGSTLALIMKWMIQKFPFIIQYFTYLWDTTKTGGQLFLPKWLFSFCFHSLQIKNIHEFVFSEYRISLTALIPLLISKEISLKPQQNFCIMFALNFMDFFFPLWIYALIIRVV